MQFIIRLNVITGIVVLLAAGSSRAVAQQYYASPPPVYGYAPSDSFGGYQVYPSPGYANGFYEQGYSYPVLPPQVIPSVAPTQVTPAATIGQPSSGAVASEPIRDSDSASSKPGSDSKTTGFEKLRNVFRDHVPSAASILGLENGLKGVEVPDSKTVDPISPASKMKTESAVSKPADSLRTSSPESAPDPLNELLAIQSKIDAVLPRLLPAVVAVEGGSGVIVSSEGHILTASHVTKKAGRTIFVRLADGRSVQARTLGTNVNSDTAALKLVGNGPWPFVQMGDSTVAELGDWCLTLGYPLSFERGKPAAVRIGRILKKSKSRFVTDSPIMGGDSGGPLFDLDGELIAISSRIKSDVSQNLFVPIERYQTQWQQLASSIDVPKMKRSQTSYLGILGETDFDRVRIRRVYQGSPAAKAGLLENDVIISFGGKRVGNFDDVANVLKARKPGEEVIAQLNRYGTLLNVSVRLGSNGGG